MDIWLCAWAAFFIESRAALGFFSALGMFFTGKYPYYPFLALNSLFVLLVIAALAGKNRSQLSFDDSGVKGTSDWASSQEVLRHFSTSVKSEPGVFLGRYGMFPLVLPAGAEQNRNVAVFGPPDTGKSRAYVRNNLFHTVRSGWSVIVTDPKGELTRDFREWFFQKGYEVRVFNLVNLFHSDRWNPVAEIKTDIDAQLLCEIIISATQKSGAKTDPFWDRAEMNLLKALVLYVSDQLPPEKRNMGAVYDLLASGDSKSLHALFSSLPHGHPAILPYNVYAEMSDAVKAGAISGLGTRLQVFQNRLVRDITSAQDIDLEMPGRRKCAYFCVLPDTDSTFYFLSSLFFSFLFIRLTRLADEIGGALPVPVHFIMDEFCNIGHIPDFTKKLSTMRSRGIGCSIIFQSIPQLKEFYPGTAWETILSDCATWLVMGVKDMTTAEYISRYAGKGTLYLKSHTQEAGIKKLWDMGRDTFSYSDRPIIHPDELVRLSRREALVFVAGLKPVRIKKMDYTKDPMSRELKPLPVNEYVPLWQAMRTYSLKKDEEKSYLLNDNISYDLSRQNAQKTWENKSEEKTPESSSKLDSSFWR